MIGHILGSLPLRLVTGQKPYGFFPLQSSCIYTLAPSTSSLTSMSNSHDDAPVNEGSVRQNHSAGYSVQENLLDKGGLASAEISTFVPSSQQAAIAWMQAAHCKTSDPMAGFGAVFTSLFVMLNKKTYILLRIEFLVVIVTILFLIMSIMDIFRRHFHSPLIKSIFNILDAVSDSIVLYILGAMKTARIKNQLFPVWAIVLVNFRNSIDFISGYGVPDRRGRRFTEWRNVVKLLGAGFLNQSSHSMFLLPLWSLWAMQILRSSYRFYTRNLAVQSIWHGQSSSLISEYMRTDREPGNFKVASCDPQTMEGYKYLVYGETNRNVTFKKPEYVICLDSYKQRRKNSKSKNVFSTLDKIWQCDGHLLQPNNSHGDILKDLSLSFALYRLLRCRLEDVTLHADAIRINQKLIRARVIEDDAKRTFWIMEVQLAFLNDYFNTRYPMVFWCGLPSLLISLVLAVVNFAVACWLSAAIRNVINPPDGDTTHQVHGFNVDIIITWVFMVFMMFKDIWEMVTCLLSDWTRLLLTCLYERLKSKCMRNRCTEGVILSFFTSKISTERWHGVIDQYVFLQSYDGKQTIWNLLHKLTIGMVEEKSEGAELSAAISIPDYVKPAVIDKLHSTDLTHGYLPKHIKSLPDRYRWACFELPTCSHIILVWHIATSLCEIKLAQGHHVDLGKPGFMCGLLSWFTRCCSSKSYLVDENELSGKLKENYIIANSLSRYCAYLLVSKPELIPDSFLVPKMVFEETMKHARDQMLKDCDSLQSRLSKLIDEANNVATERDEVKKGENILLQAAILGNELLQYENEEIRWEILAEVWAHLLVHIAPSRNAAAHKKSLESGGEFVTHIWALLWHCGIERSKLWPVEHVRDNNAPGAPQDNNAESNTDQTQKKMRQADARAFETEEHTTSISEMQRAGEQVQNSRTGNGVNDKDGIAMTETNNFVERAENKATWRDETEKESAKDMSLGEANDQMDTAEQTQLVGQKIHAEDGGEGMASIESENIRRGNTIPLPYQEKCTTKYPSKSRYDGLDLELVTKRIAGSANNMGNLKLDTADGGHGSGLVNRHSSLVRGLQNLGNTCYFNAVLQSLFALDSVRARMLQPDGLKGPFGLELRNVFMDMTTDDNDTEVTVVPKNLFDIMSSVYPCFKLGEMEDSYNLLSSFQDVLNKEEPEMVESLFRGQIDKHVSSKQCQHSSYTRQNLDLSLAIPSKKSASIEDCFELYANGDVVDWHCADCSAAAAAGNSSTNQTDTPFFHYDQTEPPDSETHQKEQPCNPQENKISRAATIEHYITKAPPVLTIQLKRFNYNVQNNISEKLHKDVSFQDILDITKFMKPGQNETEDYKFQLVAVIVHDGPTLHGGHNFAYVRASRIWSEEHKSGGTSGSWYYANDHNVKKVSLNTVLKCQAYILFYERVGHSSGAITSQETHMPIVN